MIAAIVYDGGSGVDEHITHHETRDGDLIVTYRDGSRARYEGGTVVEAWHDDDVRAAYTGD